MLDILLFPIDIYQLIELLSIPLSNNDVDQNTGRNDQYFDMKGRERQYYDNKRVY